MACSKVSDDKDETTTTTTNTPTSTSEERCILMPFSTPWTGQLLVEIRKGRVITLNNISSSDTVTTVIDMILNHHDVSSFEVHQLIDRGLAVLVLHNHKQLEKGTTLLELGVLKETTLYLTVRGGLLGGAKSNSSSVVHPMTSTLPSILNDMSDIDCASKFARELMRSRGGLINSRIKTEHRVNDLLLSMKDDVRSPLYPLLFEKHSHILPSLLAGLISYKVKDAAFADTTLSNLTSESAIRIGSAFSKSINDNASVDAGVLEFLGKYKCMQELCDEFPIFANVVTEIGRIKMRRAPWGLVWRVGIGAFLSTADMATDIYAITMFYQEGKKGFGNASLMMIGTNILCNLMVAVGNNYKRGQMALLTECLIVLSCFKPAVDAYRVSMGFEQIEGNLFDPFQEMIYGKSFEMFAEAIPALVLQTYAFLTSDMDSIIPLLSILVSCLTISYSSTMLSYDMDVSPVKRALNPFIYGYIPDNGESRLIVFLAMFSATFCQVMMQVLGVVYLAIFGVIYVGIFFSVDIGIYFIYKMVRDDFRYFLNLPEVASWVVSTITRLTAKLITDFTMNVHFRHTIELGGVYWCFNLLLHQVVAFVAGYFYIIFASSSVQKLDSSTVWSVLVGLEIMMMVSCAVFLRTINPKFIKTFFATATGKQTAVTLFRSEIFPDAQKMDIFDHHPSYYRNIHDEVKAWVHDNWAQWSEEDWFTSRVISNIPDEMIPKVDLEDLTKRGRRKSSAAEVLFGGGGSTKVSKKEDEEIE